MDSDRDFITMNFSVDEEQVDRRRIIEPVCDPTVQTDDSSDGICKTPSSDPVKETITDTARVGDEDPLSAGQISVNDHESHSSNEEDPGVEVDQPADSPQKFQGLDMHMVDPEGLKDEETGVEMVQAADSPPKFQDLKDGAEVDKPADSSTLRKLSDRKVEEICDEVEQPANSALKLESWPEVEEPADSPRKLSWKEHKISVETDQPADSQQIPEFQCRKQEETSVEEIQPADSPWKFEGWRKEVTSIRKDQLVYSPSKYQDREEEDEEEEIRVIQPADSPWKFEGPKTEEISVEEDSAADGPKKLRGWMDGESSDELDHNRPPESPLRFQGLDFEPRIWQFGDEPSVRIPRVRVDLPTESPRRIQISAPRIFPAEGQHAVPGAHAGGAYETSRFTSGGSSEYVHANWKRSTSASPWSLRSLLYAEPDHEGDDDSDTPVESEYLRLPNELVHFSTQECADRYLRVPREFQIPESVRQDLQLDDDAREMEIEIPVISLHSLMMEKSSAEDKLSAKRRVSEACRQWGVFQVTDHGIPTSMLEKTLAMTKRFFDLPQAEKMVNSMGFTEDETGYGGWQSSETESRLWGDQLVHVLRLDKSLQELNLPAKPARYGEYMLRYVKLVKMLNMQLLGACAQVQNVDLAELQRTLGDHYLKIIAKSYGTTLERLLSSMRIGESSTSAANVEAAAAQIINAVAVRVNYHPPCPQPELVLGVEPSRARSAFEIVLHNETPGLQFFRAGRWRTIKFRPNALVVFVGKGLQVGFRWCSSKQAFSASFSRQAASKDMVNQYKVVKYRVLTDRDYTRISVTTAYGMHPTSSSS
ncbi:hypothetical protein R1sor_024019 [Riccia sorocarpa]|uniref:Uncharacterized protein n=1 Tax=Riccia sorocarpa TaxID=122646 RepID=A0ABD3GPA7_9MARC